MLISNSNLNLVRRGANTLHISKKQPPPLGDPSPFLKIPELPGRHSVKSLEGLDTKKLTQQEASPLKHLFLVINKNNFRTKTLD